MDYLNLKSLNLIPFKIKIIEKPRAVLVPENRLRNLENQRFEYATFSQ